MTTGLTRWYIEHEYSITLNDYDKGSDIKFITD